MNNINSYDEFLNEEFGWKDVKKIAIGAGIVAIIGGGLSSCCKCDNIAYSISKDQQIKKDEKQIKKGKVLFTRNWIQHQGRHHHHTRQNMMIEIEKNNVYFVVLASPMKINKGDLVYLDIKGDGNGYVIHNGDVHELISFGLDHVEDFKKTSSPPPMPKEDNSW